MFGEDKWIEIFKEKNAFWLFDRNGNPKNPHALLTSGKHSDGFFNGGIVSADAKLLDQAAGELVMMFGYPEYSNVDMVVGPAMGAITLAYAVASHIANNKMNGCLTAYVEKSVDGKKMEFKRAEIAKGTKVLLVEDTITTGGSVEKTEEAVKEAGGEVLPFVLALVNRSGLKEINSKKIISLIDRKISAWDPKDCPLCKGGSEAIRPKEKDNWAKLMGR